MDLKLLLIVFSSTLAIYFIFRCCIGKRKKKYRRRRRRQRQTHIKKHYLHRPSKCYSCERQVIQTHGLSSVNLAQPTKCFDCESAEDNFLNRSIDTSMGGYGKFFNW